MHEALYISNGSRVLTHKSRIVISPLTVGQKPYYHINLTEMALPSVVPLVSMRRSLFISPCELKAIDNGNGSP